MTFTRPCPSVVLRLVAPAFALLFLSAACSDSDTASTSVSSDSTASTSGTAADGATPVNGSSTTVDDSTPTTAEAATSTNTEATTTASSTSTETSPVEDTPLDPETAAAETLDWIVALLNDPDPDPAAIEARFSESFLAEVPAEQIVGLIPQLNATATGPWSITESASDGFDLTAVIEAEGPSSFSVELALEPTAPYKIEGLLFQPDLAPPVGSIDALETELDAFAPTHRAGLYEVIDGECVAVHENRADELMPVGSVFKLWILAELAHQVEAGEASWDEVFPVQDRYKASPDGEVFGLEEGTEVTLLRYAELMISISDNSATDHLLFRLGRERVEAAMAASGVADPDQNVPFLSAADLFSIKFSPDGPSSADYRDASVDERREMLDAMADEVVPWIDGVDSFPLTNADGVELSQPRDHDIEWFATAADMCRTHVYLAELATRPGLEQVADVLSINPTAGMPFDPREWNDLRYKGGSEQGLVAVAWWMERADGRVFVLGAGLEDPDEPVSPALAVSYLQQYANFTGE